MLHMTKTDCSLFHMVNRLMLWDETHGTQTDIVGCAHYKQTDIVG